MLYMSLVERNELLYLASVTRIYSMLSNERYNNEFFRLFLSAGVISNKLCAGRFLLLFHAMKK